MHLKSYRYSKAESAIDLWAIQKHRCQPAQSQRAQDIHYQSAVGQKIPEPAAHFSCNKVSGQEPHPPPMAIAKKDNSDIFMDQSLK
jgi:hypothetical protein